MNIEDYFKQFCSSKSQKAHMLQVQKLALEMYNELLKIFPDESILKLSNIEKIISYSALLHDIGYILPEISHNKAGSRLVLLNKINGVNDDDLKIIALAIRYHRGKKPKDKHKIYCDLNDIDKRKVQVVSSIIRIADALDYNHAQEAQNIHLSYDFTSCALTLNTPINTMFNVGTKRAFEKKKTLFEQVFRVEISLENS